MSPSGTIGLFPWPSPLKTIGIVPLSLALALLTVMPLNGCSSSMWKRTMTRSFKEVGTLKSPRSPKCMALSMEVMVICLWLTGRVSPMRFTASTRAVSLSRRPDLAMPLSVACMAMAMFLLSSSMLATATSNDSIPISLRRSSS